MGKSAKVEFASETELLSEFKKYMSCPENIERAAHYVYNSLVDEAVLGTVFEMHYYKKTGLDIALEGEPEDTQT